MIFSRLFFTQSPLVTSFLIGMLLLGLHVVPNPVLAQEVTPASQTTSEATQDTVAEKAPLQLVDPTTVTASPEVVRSITFDGLITARETYLASLVGISVGDVVQVPGPKIASAIQQLYRTGLFSNVAIDYTERSGAGGIDLTIFVEEQPRLDRYELLGIKRSEQRDLRKRLSLLSGFAVTRSVKAQAISTIQDFYTEKGFWDTKVEIEETPTSSISNRVRLDITITPGDNHRIRELDFVGNEQLSDRKLAKTFKTLKEDRWWRLFKRHVYKEEDFEEGVDNVLALYREQGFRDVRITQDSVFVDEWRNGDPGVIVKLDIEEGPQYKVRNISWDGNTIYTDEQLSLALEFESGDIFNESKYQENLNFKQDNSDITSLYHNVGYLFFDIRPTLSVVGKDSVDMNFEIIENDIATISEVTFTGNEKTHDDVVRRTLRTVPGQTYSRANIIRSIRELGNLGYFSPEGINPVPYPNFTEKTVELEYQLDESQSTDNFEFSGGFGGRQIGVILSARMNFNNFSLPRALNREGWSPIPSGDGQKLSLGVQVTGRGYQSYSMSFQEPWNSEKNTSLGFFLSYDVLNYNRNYFSLYSTRNYELFNTSLSIGKRLRWPDDYFQISTALSYQLYNVEGQSSFLGTGTANILSIRQVIERNSLDNFISPMSGSKFSLSAEVAPPLAGFNQYYKLKTSYQHHHTIIDKLVLSASTESGYIGYFGAGERSNFQRFYLGGTQIQQRQNFINDNIDMRGFPGGFNGVISPVDDFQVQVGGRMYVKHVLELRYPAVSNEQLQLIPYLFVDAGNAYANPNEFDPFRLKRAAGMGARVFLPILGLVDLSYGYRLDGTAAHNDGDGLRPRTWEFLFNIGAPF
ncbi:MAG: outer membrane protein assembly factor BamA [Bacteroidetes bacterium]|nr:outer membrane protein assembly factor BamA [Bacteroidota bacterium]